MVYNFFNKRISAGNTALAPTETLATRNKSAIKNEDISQKELAEELRKLIIRIFKEKYTRPYKSILTFYR